MKEKVAFVCVHNSCRSQIAEALGKSLASEIFESYSAGTETKPQICLLYTSIFTRLHTVNWNGCLMKREIRLCS